MREREAWPELSDRDPKCQDPVTAGLGVWGPEHAESDERRARSGGERRGGAEVSGAPGDSYT
jgi:hypothetical protein